MNAIADMARDSGRSYLGSHHWITFRLDLQRLPWDFWERIGEARSKCRHLAYSPLPPTLAQELSALYLAKGVHATTAIEGNTLTEEQALDAVKGQLSLPRSQEYLGQEIENIVQACRDIEQGIFESDGTFTITPELLGSLNARVLEGLEVEDHVVPGELRRASVGVGGVYRGAPWEDCGYLVSLLCDWLNGEDFRAADPRGGFLRAMLRAAVAHVYIAWIHPFGDGNGRTARLVEFGILTAAGVPTVAAHLLSNHYNATRSAYYRQLNRASQSGGDLDGFLLYAISGFVDQLQDQLKRVQGANLEAAWTVYVHESFAGDHTPAPRRQRDLVLALGLDWVARDDIATLSPKLARDYASKGTKTVTRDINALVDRGLIERTTSGTIRARREIMLGFLPPVAATLVTED